MRLFLLRHAHARDTWPDETRHLSARGLNQIKKLFSTLDKSMFSDVVQIWHSPYLRARQTAEEFKRIASIGAPLVENAFLRPADSAAGSGSMKSRHTRHPSCLMARLPPYLSTM